MTAGADAGRSGGAAPLFAPGPEGNFHSPSARSSSPDLVAGGLWTPDPWLVGLLGAAELDREKSLAGSLATAAATPVGAVPLHGGVVEVRFLSLPPLSREKSLVLLRLDGNGAACVASFLKVLSWARWERAVGHHGGCVFGEGFGA